MSGASRLNVISARPARPTVSEWMNGRCFCRPCQRVYWIVRAVDATVVCPICQGPVEAGSWDSLVGNETAPEAMSRSASAQSASVLTSKPS